MIRGYKNTGILLRPFLMIVLLTALLMTTLTGCGQNAAPAEATTEVDYSKLVADDDEMIDVDEVVMAGMTPITGTSLKDGTYPITVATSSTMFPVTDCQLTVDQGKMTAVMTMSGTGYLYVYMGSGLEAAKAKEADWIPFEEDKNGKHTFTVPVSALNDGLKCASFSKRKGKWYNRMLCFRADSLPQEAFAEGVLHTADSLKLKDGEYMIEMTMGGGTGRAEVESPLTLKVKDGACTAEINWSSSNYDYMIVDGEKIDPITTEDHSVFEIPVKLFDMPVAVIADTTAMSKPYEIEYTMLFDSSTIKEK